MLDKFNSNIIKWYPIKENSSILQIGENDNITRELKEKGHSITLLKSIDSIDITEKYDYILIYGYEKYSNIISKIKNVIKDDGKILVIGNNETGIQNWSKYSLKEDTGILKLENKNNIHSLQNVITEIKENDLTQINTFFIFPNYTIPDIIINENFNIQKNHIEKYNIQISEDEIEIFDEKKVLKNIIDNSSKMMSFFTNSYFIEISKEKIHNDIRYVSFNNWRKEQYQLITIIKDNVVEKIPANNSANIHIKNINEIINNFNNNFENLDYAKDGIIYSKYVPHEKTLDELLAEKSDDINYIVQILNKFKDVLLQNAIKYQECKENITIDDNEEMLNKLNFLENCYWDMVPKNCFYIDNKFIFFDQEWQEKYLPIEFILYRAVLNSYDLVRKIDVDDLLKRLNIFEYKELFRKIDDNIRRKIIDEEIYKLINKKDNIKRIDNYINENKAYLEELERKEKYIKDLKNETDELIQDSAKKQQYIQALENELNNIKDDNRKKQEYIENLEKMKTNNEN